MEQVGDQLVRAQLLEVDVVTNPMWIRATVRARVTKANDSTAVWARPHGAVWTRPMPTSIAQTTGRTGHLRVLTSQKRNDDDEAEAHEAEEEREIDR